MEGTDHKKGVSPPGGIHAGYGNNANPGFGHNANPGFSHNANPGLGYNANPINIPRNETNFPRVHGQPQIPSRELLLETSLLRGASAGPSTNVTTNIQAANYRDIPVVPVGPDPMRMRCYHCLADIMTDTTTVHKDTAHLCCLLTGSSTCCLCFWIPYCCCNVFQKVDHKCPNCRSYLGTYNG